MNKVNVKIRHVIFSLLLIVSLIAFIGMSQNAPRLEPDFIRREPYYATAFLSESGTSTNPYVIGSSDDMHELSRRVAAGERFTNKVFVLGADISELNLGNFKPIGTSSYPFEGTFDGSGVNFVLSISNTSSDYQGLFGYVRNATLENFSVSGTISGRSYVGSIVGFMATGGTIRNVYSTATVTASSNYAGGILGYLERGTVTNTYFRGEVLANYYAAGIVGGAYNTNTITNSYSAGKVSANSTAAGVVNEMDNRYNTRSNLYYDITVIADYVHKRNQKPSALASTQGITSEELFTSMQDRLGTAFTFVIIQENYGYYPQLKYFALHGNSIVRATSLEANTIYIGNGIGTEKRPFLIRTIDDIEILKSKILHGETFRGFHFKVADGRTVFNLGNFSPIGINGKPFYGSFDGNNVEFILSINTTADYQGLFGRYGHGTIKNLSISGSIKGGSYTGAVVGYKESGNITGVYNHATINGVSYVGGIAGYNLAGNIEIAYNNASVTASSNYAGGILGYIERGAVNNTYNRGEILSNYYAAGIVGGAYNTTTITNSYSAGLVSANSTAAGVVNEMDNRYNTRTNLYYDVSILVTYDQKRAYKPQILNHSYGVTSSQLLYGKEALKLPNNIWYFEEKSGSNAYYPQLIKFSTSEVTNIKKLSKESVTYDVEDGLGTKEYPFILRTKHDFDELSRKVKAGNTFLGFYFKIDDDIDEIDLEAIAPIGNTTYPFEGTFDGNGANLILSINNTSSDYQGLFGYIRNATLENFSISGSVSGRTYVGSVAGYMATGSTIKNVYSTANITASSNYAGGILGYLERGTVTNTYFRGEVLANYYAAGIVGGAYNSNTITNSYSAGKVSANSTAAGVVNEMDNRYNTRSNLYYDITVIANYDNKRTQKPSTDPSTQGLNSGEMYTKMKTRLGSGWVFLEPKDNYAYYPQLSVFESNDLEPIQVRSELSVRVDVEDGMGTQEYPFIIRTKEDLDNLKVMINKGNTYKGFYFKMDDGINQMELGNYSPIGINGKPFYGSFDGNNVEFILSINTTADYQGLFGRYGHGTIKNLSISGSIKGGSYTGAVVGYKESGNITGVYNHATINGVSYVGGIAGYNLAGNIEIAYNNASVTASSNYAGGILGYIERGAVNNTYNRGEILSNYYAAGIVGGAYNTTTITNSYSAGLVSANSTAAGVVNEMDNRYNTRTNLYYDVSILVTYDQKRAYKPQILNHSYGVTSSQLLYGKEALKLPNNIWYFEEKSGSNAYYPQLIKFSTSEVTNIKKLSKESVTYDVEDGLGTKEYPFILRTKHDFDELSRKVKAGNTFLGFYFKIDDDIDEIDLEAIAPIGNTTYPFEGTFDGNGANLILSINNTSSDYQGLFGYIRNATLENFSISGSVSGRTYVGSVAGYMATGSTIKNVYSTANITASSNYAGGILGYLERGTVTNTYFRGEVLANYYAAGIVGGAYNSNTITNSYSAGKVSANSTAAGVVNEMDNRYNTRSNLYYDITVIANYDNKRTQKPSTDPSTQGLNSGEMYTKMKTRLGSGWVFLEPKDNYAYYPQLSVFESNDLEPIQVRSELSVRVDVEDGMGTQEYPFIIRTKEDLDNLKVMINKGNTYKGFYFKMDDGINQMELGNYSPIGINGKPFYGSFDGNNVEFILSINTTADYQGLFGRYGHGTIKNLSISGSIKGGSYTGAVVGYKESGNITGVYNHATINGVSYVGGIAGYNLAGNIEIAYNNASVTASSNYAGGILGYIERGAVNNTYNRGEILSNYYAAGIVGGAYNTTTITNSYSAGLVSANSTAAGVVNEMDNRYNTRTNLYYDVSVLENYKNPRNQKPSITVGGQGLLKTSMFEDGLKNRGFSENFWVFTPIEGMYAYYPQLKIFNESQVEEVVSKSILSVRTNAFIGDGTKASPYLISTVQDLINLSSSIGKDFTADGVYYLVGSNISTFDLANTQFKPIGSEAYPFNGHFDGNYANFNLKLNNELDYQALFGSVGQNGSVKRLSVTGHVTGKNYIGSIVGKNEGLVEEVYAKTNIQGTSYVGGLIGRNEGTLRTAYFTGSIEANGSYIGGIAGENTYLIDETYVSASVLGQQYVGAILGYNLGEINKSYYNQTLITYLNPGKLSKPTYAVSNELDTFDVLGLEKEKMFTLNDMSLSSFNWMIKETTGMYNYFLQIKGFGNNVNATIKTNAQLSVRVIRFKAGEGTESNPYLIENEFDMKTLSDISKEETLDNIYFKVIDGVTQIDLSQSSLNFNPIGSSSKHFKGHFDGNHTSFILDFNRLTSDYLGLFGYIENAKIKNLTILGKIIGRDYIAALAGYALNSEINNVSNKAVVQGRSNIAGLIGYADQVKLNQVYNRGNIKGSTQQIGGILGYSVKSTLYNVYNDGLIEGNRLVGGLIGNAENQTKVTNAYNKNHVYGQQDYVGGLFGYINNGQLNQAYSAGYVRGKTYLGGLIGRMSGISTIKDAYYDETIIESDNTSLSKPTSAVSNLLNQETVRGVLKADLIGGAKLSLPSEFIFKENENLKAFYPELLVFYESENKVIRDDSYESTMTHIFAGEGTISSPYLIVNEFDMVTLSRMVKEGFNFKETYFKVRENKTNFNLTNESLDFEAIGSIGYPFEGIFDGNGANFELNIIKDLNDQGLFGYLGLEAVVKNLSVSGLIKGNNYVGLVAGRNFGQIDTVHVKGELYGKDNLGTIIGHNAGTLTNAYSISTIYGESIIGGLVGLNTGTIKNTYSATKISGKAHVGALIGINEGTLQMSAYNEEILQMFELTGYIKVTHASSNEENSMDVKALNFNQMYSGTLTDFTFDDSNTWVTKAASSFEVYYPQLKYFAGHKNANIVRNSLQSVTALRFKQGEGTEKDPYIIRNEDDMQAVSDLILSGQTLKGIYFKVDPKVSEINLDNLLRVYVPIGNENYKFEGNFDGSFVTFVINHTKTTYYEGIFGYIGKDGVVHNFSVEGSLKGTRFVGAIAGRNLGTILNVYNLAKITSTDAYAGGITGYNEGKITHAYNLGDVEVITYDYAGGISGFNTKNGVIENSFNRSLVKARYYVGGLIGYNQGNLFNSYAASKVTGEHHLGGAIGYQESGKVDKVYYDLSVQNVFNEKVVRALSNVEDSLYSKGVTTLSLTYQNENLFDENIYVFKLPDGFNGYYPELKIFKDHENEIVSQMSFDASKTNIYQGYGSENHPYFFMDQLDITYLEKLIKETKLINIYFKVFKEKETFNLNNFKTIGSIDHHFEGHIDFNQATLILNQQNGQDELALFHTLTKDGSLKNVNLTGTLLGKNYVAGLVLFNEGLIHDVTSTMTVKGKDYVGGIISINDGIVHDVFFKGKVESTGRYTAGIVSYQAKGDIYQVYNLGEISSTSNYVAGITAYNGLDAVIHTAFNDGKISTKENYAAGIATINFGFIENAYNANEVSANHYVAGIAATNEGHIKETYHYGNLIAKDYVAGIVVSNLGTVSLSYYDKESVVLKDFNLREVESAIFKEKDTIDVKGLFLKQMTGLQAIGNNDEQMDFNPDKYVLRDGFDFTSHYPELKYFNEHKSLTVRNDSYQSVLDQKLLGQGTKENPYIIYDGYDMLMINDFVIKGYTFKDKYFMVSPTVNLIDLSLTDLNYRPIGDAYNAFEGNFDGNKKTFILNMNLSEENLGIFHTLGKNAVVHDFKVTGTIIGLSYVGTVASRNEGYIYNIENYANVKSISINQRGGNSIGGIVSVNAGQLENVTNHGKIEGLGSFVGGIAGENDGSIKASYNKGIVSGPSIIGGITGINRKQIKHTYNMAQITATVSTVGGIAGENNYIIEESFNNGTIISNKDIAGGLVGLQSTTNAILQSVYNTAKVYAYQSLAGGIIGKLDNGLLIDSYQTESVYSQSQTGLIVGQFFNGNVSNSYYDLSILNNHNENNLFVGTKAFGDFNLLDTLTVKGLDHSRMIGLNSLNDNQIKFTNKALFVTKASFERYSYYVQIKFFTNHTNYDVVSDSILSVQTHTFKTGLGTETDPYIIKDEIDMILLSDTVNSGNTYKNTYFKVDPNKINFILSDQDNTYKFNPIGNKNFAFEGIFDGSYANFELDLQSNVDYQALFGHVGSNGSIKNLSVTGIITGKNYTASIIGKNLGKLETSYAKASVTGVDNTGGLVGYNEGIITNVYHNGRLLGRNYVGNISGYNKGTIKNTISYGVIYGENHVGTVIGYNEKGNVENNYYDLTVLSAYSNYQQFIKPTDAISNDKLSSNIGLVRMFMIGLDSLGTSQTKMNLDKEVWSNNYNIFDFNNYPQLKAFARHENQQVKNLSYESTRNELYTVTLDFMDEELTYERTVYVLKNEYYSLTKPFKYGHKLEGWYLNDGTKLTDDSGLSLKPFEFNENIHAFAKYELQSHKVRFIDGDGKIIDELEVLHGGKARASIQTPTKNKTSTKVYEFINWNFDFDTVILKSTDIYANYKEINRYFEVTYLDGDSKFFRTEKAEYDTELLLTSYIPTKTYDEFAYKFVGWDTVIIKVKENLIIYSIFESVPRYYEIRFHDSEGFIYQIQTIEYGSNLQNTDLKVTKQSTVSHDFIFTSWDKDLSFIDKNLDVYPIFEEKLREYEVKFIDGNGKLFESQKVKYGTYPKPIENEPRKASVGLVAYKFIGLDKAFELVTGPKTYYAVFEEIPRYSEVRFIDGNGKICFTTTTEYLFDSKLPEFIPSKAPTDKYAYTFVKWEDNYKEIREDTTVYAVFSEDLRPFTVTFLDGDGFIHETQIVRYGMNASAPTQPRKTPIGNIAYQFVSWDHSLSHITSDVTIKPSFIEVPRYYQVIFTDYTGELILKTEIVEYLEGATPPLVPERTHTNEKYEYVFTSWSEDITKIIQDIVVKPIYEERVKTYQITLVNGDEIQTLTLAHGSSYMLYEGKKTSTDKISYEFIGWKLNGNFVTELKNVTSNLTLYAEFNEVHHYFVVNFLDGNGELFEVVYVNKNEILQYPTKTPTKQKTADYIYVFKAWDKVLTIIEEDTTIYPIFDTYQRFNEVNFFDAYGNLIKSEIVEYGKAATLPAQPIKRETEMYRYEFQGWNKNISNIQRDTDVYPVYKELLREFSVNFYDGNNLVYQSFLVTYGTSINQNFETTKTPTSDTYFIFSYWDKPTDFITNDLNIYPIFEEVSRYYDVTFIYLDINEVETSLTLRVEYRKDAYDPRYDLPIILISDTKVKAIAGWDSELTNVKENRVIYAQYEIFDKYHEVRFFVDDTLVLNVLASYGEDITPSISPTKEQTVYERYKFIGWDKDLNYITSSMDVYAVFETLSNRLTITFLDGDGNIFDVLEVMYGTDLSNYDGIPEKRPTKEFTYMFIGWDKDLTWVERDLIVIPRFEEKVRYYQVIFLDQHGQTLKVETLAYGKRATAPTNYQVPLDDETYRYEARFNKPFDYITEDLIVELEIIKLLRLYQVTIYDALGEVYERLALPYGEEIILPTEMHKASSPQYNYIFIGWDNEELIVTKDTSFTPLFSESLRYYLVTYVDGDENIICEELVPYQGNGTIPGIIPTKIDNQMYRYEFRMWDKKPINITKDTTIYAVFNQYLKQYTVTFLDEFDNVILIQEVLYGQGAIEPSLELIPMKPSTNTFDYVYAGWDKQFNRITEDTVLRIRYLAVLRLYTYTFYDDDHTTILKEVKGQYGIEIIAPIVSDKRIGENVYRFVSWNKALDSYLERDVEFFAIYELKPSLYTVNFYDDNRNIISTQYIEHGKQAIAPNQPLKTQTDKYEYIFLAWSRSFERVEENLDIYPLYEERIRQFKVKFNYEKEVLLITKSYGESINVNELKIPTKLGHHFVKWDQSLTFITKDLEVNPIFEKNTYEIVYIVHDADSGAMEHQIVSYLEQVTLYKNLFKKKGYEFKGWKLTLDGDVVSYNDLETFTYTLTDNLYLYAHFEAIQFEVIYDSDGGTVLEKDFYTIEKGVAILPTPVKPNHIFIGWVLEDIILPEENLMRILNFGVEDKGTIVTEISEGLIGTIMLKARYQYNGYIRIKEAYQDINQLVYADVTSIIPIIERTNDENIVYFIGLKPNETLAEIKERIENPEFDFVDNKGNIITDLNQIVKTGISLIVRDQNYPEEILDEVILVLKGDINGDGKINSIDYNSILNHISNRVPIEKASLIAALINADDKVNVTDLNVLLNYINGKTNIFA